MKSISISLRLTAWYACISMVGLAIFGTLMWYVLTSSMLSWKDRTLQMRASRIEAALATPPPGGKQALDTRLEELFGILPEGEWIQIVDRDGNRLFPLSRPRLEPSVPAAACPTPWIRDYVVGRDRFRQLCHPVRYAGGPAYLLAPSPLAEDRILLGNFTSGLYRAIPIILMVSALGGYMLSRRALQPVDVLIAEARAVSPDDLSRRLTVSSADDQLRHLAMEWNSLLARIEAAMIRVTQFTADASHELRNPIAFIRATAEYSLGNTHLDEESREAFQGILDEARMTSDLLENLLALARPDAELASSDLQEVDVTALLRELADYFAPALQRKQQSLSIVEAGDPRPFLRINALHLRRILVVMLDNAMKYTPPRGQVTVSTQWTEELRVRIADNGVGIPAEHLDRIFDRFYRVDPARSEMGEGVGLGLSIAQWLMKIYGGTILVESEPGSGSTFTLVFPSERLQKRSLSEAQQAHAANENELPLPGTLHVR